MKKLLIPTTGLALLLAGCGGSGSASPIGANDKNVVTDNPRSWMTWAELQQLPEDTKLQMRVSVHGTDVYELPVTLRSTLFQNGDETALVQTGTDNPLGIGDEGSPVLLNGKVVGSLFSTADAHHINVRSIEQQMQSVQGNTAPAKIVISTSHPEWVNSVLQSRGRSFASNYVVQRRTSSVPVSRATDFSPIPGRKFVATYLSGPDSDMSVTAAFSLQLADGRWLATGHSLGGDKIRKLPVSIAFVDGRLNDGSIWDHPVGNPFGTLIGDTKYGSVIDATADRAVRIPVTVKLGLDGGGFTHVHQVTADNDSNEEQVATEMALLTGLYNEFGGSREEMYGDAVLTLHFADGSSTTFDFKTDPNEDGDLRGTGVDVFFEIDFWVRDKLSSLVGSGNEATSVDLDVDLQAGFPPATAKKPSKG